MPRKNETVIDVNAVRAEFYAEHFQCRQFARNHPDRENIARLVSSLPRPELTVYGAPGFEGRIDSGWASHSKYMLPYYELWKKIGVDAFNLYAWYWSDGGWSEFERAWNAMPEVVHMDVCTNGKVVHICTQDSYSYPTGPD